MKIEDMLINEELTIFQTMQQLDQLDITARKILFVVRDGKLVAVVSDGDVRRWILSNGSLEAPISCAANYKPKFMLEGEEENAAAYMQEQQIDALPVLNTKFEVIKVLFRSEKEENFHSDALAGIPIVIMAGGLGKRLYPYTRILPKPLIPIGDVPIIEHIMNEFGKFGCKDFYLILNHKKNMIKAYFSDNEISYNITYVDETFPLGTGGGLSLLKGQINSTFILTNCDILIKDDIARIYKLHKEQKHLITMVCSAKSFTIPYGVINIDEEGEITEIKEKPSLSFLTNTGCYVVEPEVINEMESDVAIDFTDVIERFRKQGKKVGVYPIGENSWFDMGQMDELRKMEKALLVE